MPDQTSPSPTSPENPPTNLSIRQTTLIGKTLGSSTSETTFATRDLPNEHRIIGPGPPYTITQDYVAERLNVYVDEQGVVTGVYYG